MMLHLTNICMTVQLLMSNVMRKPVLQYANNKGVNQPAHPHSLISAFVVRCLDSIIPLLGCLFKPVLQYANNKGADQPAHPRSLISAFVVRCLDSIIPLLACLFKPVLQYVNNKGADLIEVLVNKSDIGCQYCYDIMAGLFTVYKEARNSEVLH